MTLASRQTHDLRGSGFSLLEMLVATGLLVVIMLGLMAMFYQTERAFRLAAVQVDTLEGGRAAMELLIRDLQEISPAKLALTNFHFYVALTQSVNVPFMNLGGNETRENVFQPFFFMRHVNDQWRGVRYDFLGYQLEEGAATLHRLEFTMPLTNAFEMAVYLATNTLGGIMSRGQSLPAYYGTIVEGVVHLSVKALDNQGNTISNYPPTLRPIHPFFYTYGFEEDRLPASLEVELGILDTQTYQRFKNMTTANKIRFLASSAANVHLFRRRVPVRSTE